MMQWDHQQYLDPPKKHEDIIVISSFTISRTPLMSWTYTLYASKIYPQLSTVVT